jgi:hypothetical protein
MKGLLRIGAAVMILGCGQAMAQTSDSTTTQSAMAPAVPPPPPAPGTLSTSRTVHAVDAYGNRVDQQQTTYRDMNGVAQDSRTVTTTQPVPPPPPVTTTTTTTQSTTTGPQ